MLPYSLLTSDAELATVLPLWRVAQVLAMDTEVAHAHQVPQRKQCVSLVQVWDGTSPVIWLIDAFSVNLKPFREQVMASPRVTKLFHDAPHDLRILKCTQPRGVVCTLEMAQARAQPRCSLKALSSNLLNVEMDKRYQASNWALRPLSPEQLHYAALDAWVTYNVWRALSLIPEAEIPTPQ